MSDDVWQALRTHSYDKALSCTVRTAHLDAGGTTLGHLSAPYVIDTGILPVSAEGSIVYFTSSTGTLNGISVGTENAPPTAVSSYGVLRGDVLKQRSGKANCVGCHTETPDDNFVLVSSKFEGAGTTDGDWYGSSVARINANDGSSFGATPSSFAISPLAQVEMGRGVGGTASSKSLWDGSRKLVVGWFGEKQNTGFSSTRRLKTVDLLSGTATEIPTIGSTAGVLPAWSADGKTIYYTTTKYAFDARVGGGPDDPADIMAVPFNVAGGTANGLPVPVNGASDPQAQEFYPAVSPDSEWLGFNRIAYTGSVAPDVGANPINPESNIAVIPAAGGARHDLVANDAMQCPTDVSTSVRQGNRWPKWAPTPKVADGAKYYFVVFSSQRRVGVAQLYVAPIMVSNGVVTSYGALYLRSQDPSTSNHTPVWSSAKVESNPNVLVQ